MNGMMNPAMAIRIACKPIFMRDSLGDRRGRERRQGHRRSQVGHDAEIEDEHVRDDQRHAELQQRRRCDANW